MAKTGWTKEMMANWHKEALPECTCGEQRIKAHKEASEYYYAKRHNDKKGMLEEMADFYIVNVILHARYHDQAARFVCERIEHFKQWEKISAAVDAKMDINATRKFEWKNGEWRHIEE